MSTPPSKPRIKRFKVTDALGHALPGTILTVRRQQQSPRHKHVRRRTTTGRQKSSALRKILALDTLVRQNETVGTPHLPFVTLKRGTRKPERPGWIDHLIADLPEELAVAELEAEVWRRRQHSKAARLASKQKKQLKKSPSRRRVTPPSRRNSTMWK